MPALPNVPNVIRVACKGSSGGAETWLTRFYLQYPTVAPSAANLVSLGNEIITSWNTHLNPLATANKTLTEVDLQDLTNPSAAVATIATSQVGTRAQPWLPPAACTVVSYSIGRRYRGGHPRGYWPLGGETDLDTSGQWLPLYVTTVDVGIRAFFSDVTSFIWAVSEITKHCNVSYYSGFTVVTDPITGRARNVPKLRAGGPVVDLVSTQSARIIVGTQRRRGQF